MDNLLRDINFGENQYCGPSALSAITGLGTDECASMLSRITGRAKIVGIGITDMLQALHTWRYTTEWIKALNGASLYFTLTVLHAKGDGIYLVQVPGHYITIEIKDKQPYICDNHTRSPINAASSARLMQNIVYVYKVVAKKEPKLIDRKVVIIEGINMLSIKIKHEFDDPTDNMIYEVGQIRFRDKEDRNKIKLALMEAL